MLLVIDIGNTNITLGLFKLKGSRLEHGPLYIWRLSTDKFKTSDEYGSIIIGMINYIIPGPVDIGSVAIASVVPVLNPVFEEMCQKYFKQKPFFVGYNKKLPMNILYNNPEDVGADRIANAVAAQKFYDTPVIIIDFGTATTFDCINKKGDYLGGVIAPGPVISVEALSKRTAKLPMVDIINPQKVIGKSTIESIQSGIFNGYVGLIKEILKKIIIEMQSVSQVIATGGLAHIIVPHIKEVKKIDNDLTIQGIRLIWELSKNG